jgi:hypothetical protein
VRLVRLVSVTAAVTATCALWALPASAATAAANVRHPSTTTVTATPGVAWVGATVRLSARVRSSGRTPTGTVSFLSFGRTMCVAHLSHGTGACNASFGAISTYTVRGFYSGDRTHKGSVGATRVTVRRSPTTTKITVPNGKIDVGSTFLFRVTVTGPAGTPAPTGTVRLAPVVPVNLPGYTCTATLIAGHGACSVKPSRFGIHNYAATYSGNKAHRGSASDGKFVLTALNKTSTSVAATSTTTGAVTLNATVLAMGWNITQTAGGTGTVSFSYTTTQGGTQTPITVCTDLPLATFDPTTGNHAVCTGSSSQLNLPAKGTTVYITAVFSGDPGNEPSSTAMSFTTT